MYVIVAGAGLIGRRVTDMLVKNKHDVVVIDKNPEVCESVYAETGALTINGNATNIQVLEKAGATKADVIICLMRLEADNIACSLLSKYLGIPRIIARLREPSYEQPYQLSGVTTIVRMADLILNMIMMEVEQPEVRKIIPLGGGKADIYMVKIPPKAKSIGMTIKDIAQHKKFPKECLFVGIYREEEDDFLIPRGNRTIQEGEAVFLVSKSQHIKQATDFLTRTK